MAIKENQGAERLILCGCGYFPSGGEIGKKFLNFIFSHIFGMVFVVKEDITPNPIYVSLFRSTGIMLQADSVANLVEKLLWFLCHRSTSHAFFMLHFSHYSAYF